MFAGEIHSGNDSSILDRLAGECHLRSPLLGKIFPTGIRRLDERNLLRSRPALQLLLASKRSLDIVKALVVDQPVASVLAGEPFDFSALVFQCAPVNGVGHADVECS